MQICTGPKSISPLRLIRDYTLGRLSRLGAPANSPQRAEQACKAGHGAVTTSYTFALLPMAQHLAVFGEVRLISPEQNS